MKCDRCENEATVHEVTIRNGAKVDRHLCERCAGAAGFDPSAIPISQVIKEIATSHAKASMKPGACPGCGMTFAEFKQQGLLGCPDCYVAFEGLLAPLLERAHEGGIAHVGKRPSRAAPGEAIKPPEPSGEDRLERLRRIRRDLELALQAEQYEKAAALRDELRSLGADIGVSDA
jgi:protein arginine kinase activator